MTRCVLVTIGLLVLAGCAGETRVIDDLPPPVMQTHARRPQPKPPPPAHVKPKDEFTRRSIRHVTIVVDAGHGGKDPGAPGVVGVPEKTVNLRIARELARRLEQAGAHVVTTRSADRFISLDGRAAMAERTRADLFVSIHADAAKRSSASGATIYIARSASGQSRHAADCVAAALKRAGINCRGVNGAGFRVLVGHSRPAMLVECGFLTNHEEARKLASSAYQAKIADAIADGIADHFGS